MAGGGFSKSAHAHAHRGGSFMAFARSNRPMVADRPRNQRHCRREHIRAARKPFG
jgi:hypothetical protein